MRFALHLTFASESSIDVSDHLVNYITQDIGFSCPYTRAESYEKFRLSLTIAVSDG